MVLGRLAKLEHGWVGSRSVACSVFCTEVMP